MNGKSAVLAAIIAVVLIFILVGVNKCSKRETFVSERTRKLKIANDVLNNGGRFSDLKRRIPEIDPIQYLDLKNYFAHSANN